MASATDQEPPISELEKAFAFSQPVSDAVQRSESAIPGCCSRTRLRLGCREKVRQYSLELPEMAPRGEKGRGIEPKERRFHVMDIELPGPVLQVLSNGEGADVAEVQVRSEGPGSCPPGTSNRVHIEGAGGGARVVPFSDWVLSAPSVLRPSILEEVDRDTLKLLHPFRAPKLPAQTWKVEMPSCPRSRLNAIVASFPDVRWSGRLSLAVVGDSSSKKGFQLKPEGAVECSYSGRTWAVKSSDDALVICQWFGALEMLGKCVVSILELEASEKYSGMDNPSLQRGEVLRFDPWPQLSFSVESRLFEQTGKALLGHQLRAVVSEGKMVGAKGELSLLPQWLDDLSKRRWLTALLVGTEGERPEEITRKMGFWLIVEGTLSLMAAVEANRPVAATSCESRAEGGVEVRAEFRSIYDYEGAVVEIGGAENSAALAMLEAECLRPEESPSQDPMEKRFRASLRFSGVSLGRVVKLRPGCQIRRWDSDPARLDARVPLVPARSWPGGGDGEPIEVPWCEEL